MGMEVLDPELRNQSRANLEPHFPLFYWPVASMGLLSPFLKSGREGRNDGWSEASSSA